MGLLFTGAAVLLFALPANAQLAPPNSVGVKVTGSNPVPPTGKGRIQAAFRALGFSLEVAWTGGAALLVRREVLEASLLEPNSKYNPGQVVGADVNFCKRARGRLPHPRRPPTSR